MVAEKIERKLINHSKNDLPLHNKVVCPLSKHVHGECVRLLSTFQHGWCGQSDQCLHQYTSTCTLDCHRFAHNVVKKCLNMPTKRRVDQGDKQDGIRGRTSAGKVHCGLFLRSRAQNTEADVQKDHPFLRSSKRPFLLLFCFVLFCFVLFANWVEEAPFQNLAKKHGVVSGRMCFFFIFACFETTIIFCGGVARCCIGNFSCHAVGFAIIFHPAGLVGCKKNSLLGDVLTCFRGCV